MTLQLNEILFPTVNVKKSNCKLIFFPKSTKKLVIGQIVKRCKVLKRRMTIYHQRQVEKLPPFDRKAGLCDRFFGIWDEERQKPMVFSKVQSTSNTVPKRKLVAKVSLLPPLQTRLIQPVSPKLMTDYIERSIEEFITPFNNPEVGYPSLDGFWFPIPETYANP